MGCRRRHPCRGAILILTLWIIALLSLMAFGLVRSVRMGLREEAWSRGESEADELLAALGNMAAARVAADADRDSDSYLENWGRIYSADAATLLAAYEGIDPTETDFVLTVQPVDEYGKLNVNLASEESLVAILLEAGTGTQASEIAAAIIDWRDPDDTGMAESDLYLSLDPPYAPANTDLAHIDELLFVHGVEPMLFFGEDANHNGQLDPNEDDGDAFWPPDNADGRLQLGLVDLLTVFGEGTLNVNGAPLGVLRVALYAGLGDEAQVEELVPALVSRRRGRDGLDGTDDDTPFLTDEDLVDFVATKLGDDTERAQDATRSLGVISDAFRFHLSVRMPERHLLRQAELVISREEDEFKVIEWHDS